LPKSISKGVCGEQVGAGSQYADYHHGQWADTAAEAQLRVEAFYRMQELMSEGLDENAARVQVARELGINPHQVKISEGKDELDVFISKDRWDALAPEQRGYIEQRLLDAFNVEKKPNFTIDFYQDIPLEKVSPGWPNPQTNVPPGSITFDTNGTIIHQPFTK
jgi:uncharacterized protein YoaH (UPF0181 family)